MSAYVTFQVKVTRWFDGEGKQEWFSRDFMTYVEAVEYAEQAVSDGRDLGDKVVAQVWQAENLVPQTRITGGERRYDPSLPAPPPLERKYLVTVTTVETFVVEAASEDLAIEKHIDEGGESIDYDITDVEVAPYEEG